METDSIPYLYSKIEWLAVSKSERTRCSNLSAIAVDQNGRRVRVMYPLFGNGKTPHGDHWDGAGPVRYEDGEFRVSRSCTGDQT